MGNPFKKPEFLALFKHWNKILEADGHQEIEDFSLPNPPLKVWESLKWSAVDQINNQRNEAIHRYYDLAQALLDTYPFKNNIHKRIWKMHCAGFSARRIAQRLMRRKFKKTTVHVIIMQIETDSGLKRG